MSEYNRNMNRDQNRTLLRGLQRRLKRSRGFVLVVQDDDGVVRCEHDLSRCTRENDLRDVALRDVVKDTEEMVFHINNEHRKNLERMRQDERVAAAKAERSKVLRGAGE